MRKLQRILLQLLWIVQCASYNAYRFCYFYYFSTTIRHFVLVLVAVSVNRVKIYSRVIGKYKTKLKKKTGLSGCLVQYGGHEIY